MVIVPAAVDIEPQEMFQKVTVIRQTQSDAHDRSNLEFDSKLLHAVTHGEAEQVALMMHNDFQSALVSILPEHNDWLTAGMNEGALAAQTIGVGASLVFMTEDMSSNNCERFEEHGISAVAEYGPVAELIYYSDSSCPERSTATSSGRPLLCDDMVHLLGRSPPL